MAWRAVLCAAVMLAGLAVGPVLARRAEVLAGEPVPVRPRVVGAACALAWVCVVALAETPTAALAQCALATLLLVAALTDLAALVIPDCLVLEMVGVRLAWCLAEGMGQPVGAATLVVRSFASALVLVVPLLLLTLVMDRVLGQESMGGGDLKLFGVAGLCLGVVPGLAVVALSCALGVAYTAIHARATGASALEPFALGPFIALAFWIVLLAARVVAKCWQFV